jgi:hypothetical protein
LACGAALAVGHWALSVGCSFPFACGAAGRRRPTESEKAEKLKLNPVPSHFLSFQLAAFSSCPPSRQRLSAFQFSAFLF